MRTGWIVLGMVMGVCLLAACGDPLVTDLGTGATGTDTATGTATGSPSGQLTPPASGTPSGAPLPTLTNVPSFASWNANIKPLLAGNNCNVCHTGGDGGLYFKANDTPSNDHFAWFTTVCNRKISAANEGTQAFNPSTGRLHNYACSMPSGSGVTHPVNVPATVCNAVVAFHQASAGTPPSCNSNFDLDNSL